MKTDNVSTAYQLLREAEDKISSARQILGQMRGDAPIKTSAPSVGVTANIIEGVFDGQSMLGSDKKMYPVPANYASKSKLVEGDTLKLSIIEDGSFVYKQIAPVERRHVRGELKQDARGEYCVNCDKVTYRVLLASVTYFKGVPGDEVTLVLPKSGDVTWGAVDNIVKITADGRYLATAQAETSSAAKPEPDVTEYDASQDQSIPVAQSDDDQ